VFDDGARVYIQFPDELRTTDAPPLFIAGAGGKAELVNYRVSRNNYYIVDRLFDVAELRLGTKAQMVVRITRDTVAGGRHD
jgi:type IV secretion system protein VirB9